MDKIFYILHPLHQKYITEMNPYTLYIEEDNYVMIKNTIRSNCNNLLYRGFNKYNITVIKNFKNYYNTNSYYNGNIFNNLDKYILDINNDLSQNGLYIRQFDEEGDSQSPWKINISFASTSKIQKSEKYMYIDPFTTRQHIPIYSTSIGGFILQDVSNDIHCAYPGDGGSDAYQDCPIPGCSFGSPTPSPTPPTPPTPLPHGPKHGMHKVAQGEYCGVIAVAECGPTTKCNSFAQCPAICDAAKVCPNLMVGQEIMYDCGLNGAHCSGDKPTPIPSPCTGSPTQSTPATSTIKEMLHEWEPQILAEQAKICPQHYKNESCLCAGGDKSTVIDRSYCAYNEVVLNASGDKQKKHLENSIRAFFYMKDCSYTVPHVNAIKHKIPITQYDLSLITDNYIKSIPLIAFNCNTNQFEKSIYNDPSAAGAAAGVRGNCWSQKKCIPAPIISGSSDVYYKSNFF